MGPVWEANHVWLIFVLTVSWTAYPSAFGAVASTLAVPLLIAGLGIVLRGAAYALRAGTSSEAQAGLVDTIFSISSILTPFALGTIVGAIASRRVPVGNAAGNLITSWLNPTSLLIGVLAVAVAAYLAAVYLAADGARHDDATLTQAFRARALSAGVVAGAVALGGLPVLAHDAHPLFERLVRGPGVAGLGVSVCAGLATLTLVARRRFELGRLCAALAVVGMIAGWALAQQPLLLAHLTLQQAAASQATLVVLLIAIAIGAAILFPSLGLLFTLLLRGRLDHADATVAARSARPLRAGRPVATGAFHARLALAGLLGGLVLLTVASAQWAHAIGVTCLFACMIFAFLAVAPAQLAELSADSADPPEVP
jgi:cytochrome d ubiquinol oxidase subunit II